MEKEIEKPHWIKLKDEVRKYGNGRAVIEFQDGLPIAIVEIEGRRKDIKLT